MSGTASNFARPAFATTRESTRAKARDVLALVDLGLSVAAISERLGFTEARIRQLLMIGRSDTAAADQGAIVTPSTTVTPAQAKKISRRTMLDRVWVTMHVDRRLWALDRGVRSFWFEVVMTVHQLGDSNGIQFGRYGDGFEDRAEFAAAHGGTEVELESLCRRGLLVTLENGGITIPLDIGLKPWGKATASSSNAFPTVAARSAPVRAAGKAPVPGQGTFVMAIPGGASAMARQVPDANSNASGGANPCENLRDVNANICADDDQEAENSCEIGGKFPLVDATATTTEESESLGGSGGNGSRATDENLCSAENLRAESNLLMKEESPSDLPWVALGAELVEAVGLDRPLTVTEAELIRGWLDSGASPDMLRGVVRTVMERDTCPPRPALSYFNGAVCDALEHAKRAPVLPAAPRPEVKEMPEIATAWDREDAENPGLATAWAKIRAVLKTEAGDNDYRNWLRPMTLRGKDGDEVIVTLPTGFVCDWVRDRHGARVSALWLAEYPSVSRVNFCVREAPAVAP